MLINLIGILNEKKDDGKGFTYAHTSLLVAQSKRAKQITSNILSNLALLALMSIRSRTTRKQKAMQKILYFRNKALSSKASIIRPSVVFGPKDKFINKFATLVKLFNGRIPLACPQSLLQPIFVNDLVDAIVAIIENPQHKESIYELGGPEIKTLIEIVRYICEILNIKDRVIPLNYLFHRFRQDYWNLYRENHYQEII